MIGNFEFCVSILGAQRLTYPSLFFAYEDFLASTIKAKKDPNYSSKGRNIGLDLKSFSYDTLAAYCWNDAEVDLAGLVRHAVAHNSGRLGAELEKYKVRFVDVTNKHGCIEGRPVQRHQRHDTDYTWQYSVFVRSLEGSCYQGR